MKKFDLKAINGSEIINFLNKKIEDDESFYDCSIRSPLVFESQKVNDGAYHLIFSSHYNNWGTLQEICDNEIIISENDVVAKLEEPFCDDGSWRVLEKVLKQWLQTHEFDQNIEERIFEIFEKSYQKLAETAVDDVNGLQQIIDWLVEAKTLMK